MRFDIRNIINRRYSLGEMVVVFGRVMPTQTLPISPGTA